MADPAKIAQTAGVGSDMEDNSNKDMVEQLTPDGGVVKKVLQEGEGYLTPEKGDEVTVHYTGTLTDGTQFDSSRDRDQPFSFKLGMGNVIKGWDIGVASMKKGERTMLTCTAPYAYGDAGSGPTIPPGATLNFDVEVISWRSAKALTDDGGVSKTIVVEGDGWEMPQEQDEVLITYTLKVYPEGTTDEAAVADSAPIVASSPEGGLTTTAGEGALCPGLGIALRSMKVKESANITLKPEYAFGAEGREGVPPNSTVLLQLTLQEVHKLEHPMDGVTLKVMSRHTPRTWALPKRGAGVSLAGKGLLPDGSVFQEWSEESPLAFTIDEEQAPEGLEAAVMKMEKGQRCIITITDPALAYGSKGYTGTSGAPVPPDTPVTFDLTLNSFDTIKEKWSMDNSEKLAAAIKHKDKGNTAYKAGNLRRAVDQYTTAVDYATAVKDEPEPLAGRDDPVPAPAAASSGGSELPSPGELKKSCWLNLAAANLKQGEFAKAAAECSKVLEADSGSIKALYRRGQALLGAGDLLEAERDVKAGLLLEEGNKDLQLLLRKVKAALKERNRKDAALYGKMFKALGSFGVGSGAAEAAEGAGAAAAAGGDVQTEAKDQDGAAAAAAAEGGETPAAMQVDSAPVVETAA